MSRNLLSIIKHSHFTLALGAAALVGTSGCQLPPGLALEELDSDPSGSVDLTGAEDDIVAEEAVLEFAALTADAEGHLEIVILTESGEESDRIETEYSSAMGPEASEHSLMHHSEDFFLVTSRTEDWGALILRIDWDGSVSEFARPAASPMYRIDEAPGGGIIIAAEYDLVKLDLDGVEIARDHNNTACWTDVVGAPNGYDAPVAADVMGATEAGPLLAVWEIDEANPVTDMVSGTATSGIGSNNNADQVLGQDESGGLWVTGRSGNINRSQDGEVTFMSQLNEMFEDAFMARAIEPAGEQSVYVLMDGGSASQVGQVHADGTAEVLFEHSDSLLNDMVVLPVPIGF